MEGAWLSSASKPLSTVGAEVGQWWVGGRKALSSLVARVPPPAKEAVVDPPACPPHTACRNLAGAAGLDLASEDKSEPSVW